MGTSGSASVLWTVLYLYLAAAFTVMITICRADRFVSRHGDYRAYLLYFLWFALTLFVVPVGILVLGAPAAAGTFLAKVGLTGGRAGTGLLLAALSLAVAPLIAWIGARDPAMRARYPFSKQACASTGRFVRYELAYLTLYYLPWEFVFRGALFLPLVPAIGLGPALAVETIASTLYHIGHPDSEIAASLGAGFAFGLISYLTGSVLYTVFIHALIGISTDTVLFLRYPRASAGAPSGR